MAAARTGAYSAGTAWATASGGWSGGRHGRRPDVRRRTGGGTEASSTLPTTEGSRPKRRLRVAPDRTPRVLRRRDSTRAGGDDRSPRDSPAANPTQERSTGMGRATSRSTSAAGRTYRAAARRRRRVRPSVHVGLATPLGSRRGDRRADPRHGGLGRHVRPGQGRGGALSALRVPRHSVPDRDRGARTGRRPAASRPRPGGPRRRLRPRRPGRARDRAADGRARADDGHEHRLHHGPVRPLHSAARARALPDADPARALGRRRARARRAGAPLGGPAGLRRQATCSSSSARSSRRSRS